MKKKQAALKAKSERIEGEAYINAEERNWPGVERYRIQNGGKKDVDESRLE